MKKKNNSIKKSLRRVLSLMCLVCITFTANATTVNNDFDSPQVALRGDSIGSLFRLDSSNIGQILESAKQLLNAVAEKYPDGIEPVDLNLNLQFDFDIKSSQPFLLLQVIYNTLAGDDGMVNQLKGKEIKKFDEKTLKQLKKEFTKRSNKEIKKLCKGDRPTQKELKRKIKKLLDGIQIKEK